ncbi:MAG TPA: hypothetical protein PKY59_06565 [Pyrinomonadaceae bacterium]|nr:hypothetical protein [Pyrinomonadaceae bacterium]
MTKLNKIILITLLSATFNLIANAQTIKFEDREFEISNVKASVVKLNGEKVLKVERDLEKLPFDVKRLETTVDEPTFVKLKNLDLENGVIEVKMLSQIQVPSPFEFAQGFIGLAFRVSGNNNAYESIYLRPKAGRSEIQFNRNHTVQYYAYPDYKFDKLRKEEFKGQYETYADVGLNEWITMRIEIKNRKAELYLNNQKYPSFIVNEMKGNTKSGSLGLWVDIGTIGYFKDLKIRKY